MRLVFMGTPQFAVPSLECLVSSSHEVVAVVTVPDRPIGRGLKIRCSAVKACAIAAGIPVLQPEDLLTQEFLAGLRAFEADMSVVVAFRVLPPEVFEMPPKGTINLHSSLLPKYRGAAPINWAIINGEKETGVSTIFIQKSVDTGDLIFQRKVAIGDNETMGELHDRLANIGAEVLLETVEAIAAGSAPKRRQTGEATKAPKISRELGLVNWAKSNEEIRNLIRGLSPSPGATSFLSGKLIKLYRAAAATSEAHTGFEPGQITAASAKQGHLLVATGDGLLELHELQPEGKRRMSAKDFLQGHRVHIGDKFGQP